MELGANNKKKVLIAAALGVIAVLVVAYELIPSLTSTSASESVIATQPAGTAPSARPSGRRGSGGAPAAKKLAAPPNLDPTLHLSELAATEQIKYEGSGRNIFASSPDPIQTPVKNGTTDHEKAEGPQYVLPRPPQPTPIPLKFFGFASKPGEPKRIFLSEGEDVFIAGEGEIVDRRYKVIHISNASVEIQDMVSSGPPQTIPLTQG